MKKEAREALDAYYREAGSWAYDRADALRSSRRTAWMIASVAVVVAALLAIVVIALLPLKTVVPYTLLVDRHTGYVQALKPVDADKIAPDTALTQSFLVQYVVAREAFDIDDLQTNYRKVALWSAGVVRAEYMSSMQGGNPASPLALYPRSTVVDVQIKSVSSLSDRVALVRFDTQRRDTNGRSAPSHSWVAIIRYRFSDQPLALADRFVNPLGFQVERYHRNEEAAPQPEVQLPQDVPDRLPGVRRPQTYLVPRNLPMGSPLTGGVAQPRYYAAPYPPAPYPPGQGRRP